MLFFRSGYDLSGAGFGGFVSTPSSIDRQISSRSFMDGLFFASQG